MAHVGTITGSMTLDPSAYINALNQVAQHTAKFQQAINAGSYGIGGMGASATRSAAQLGSLNRSVYASMTAFYALSRTVTGALGVFEEYSNVVSRIANVADMSTSSILSLSEAMKGLNREMGGSRTDLMKGMYRAVQSGFTTPKEFMPIAKSAMALRTASGREINTTKAADAISVIRNALNMKSGKESFITDILLGGRNFGRYELNEMTAALGVPITVHGTQFSEKLGPEETLRQLLAMLSSATLSGISPMRAATGVRRMVEKTIRLSSKPGGVGKNITGAMKGLGYDTPMDALNEGSMEYFKNLLKVTGGTSQGLLNMGYGSKELMVLTSLLGNKMGRTQKIYQGLSKTNMQGLTEKYAEQQKEEWWHKRDRLRSAYEDTQLNLMQAMLPTMESFAISLEAVNDLFQALGPTLKNLIGLMLIGSGASLLKNFYLRGGGGAGGASGGNFAVPALSSLTNVGFGKNAYSGHAPIVPSSQVPTRSGQVFKGATSARFSPYGLLSAGPTPYGLLSAGTSPFTSMPRFTESSSFRSMQRSPRFSPYGLLSAGPTPYGLLSAGTSPFTSMPRYAGRTSYGLLSAGTSPFLSMPRYAGGTSGLLPEGSTQHKLLPAGTSPFLSMPRYAGRTSYGLLPAGTSPFLSMPRYAGGTSRIPFDHLNPVLSGSTEASNQSIGLGSQPNIKRPSLDLTNRYTPLSFHQKALLGGANAIKTGTNAIRSGLYTAGSAVGSGLYTAGSAVGSGLYTAGSAIGSGLGAIGRGYGYLRGGPQYRADRIQQTYDTRMQGALGKYETGYAKAEQIRQANIDSVRQADTASGRAGILSKTAATAHAGEKFESTIKKLRSEFDKSAQAASKSARGMSKFSGVLSAIGGLANMAAIGGIFQLASKFIEGFVGGKIITKTGGVEDISQSGTSYAGAWDPMDITGRAAYGTKLAGYGIRGIMQGEHGDKILNAWAPGISLITENMPGLKKHGGLLGYLSRNAPKTDPDANISHEQHNFYKERGMIWDEKTKKFKVASTQDAIELAIRENFDPLTQGRIHRAGLGTNSKTNLKEFYDWMKTVKDKKGLDDAYFMTQKGVDKTELSGYQYYGREYAEFLKSPEKAAQIAGKSLSNLAEETEKVIQAFKSFYTLDGMKQLRDIAAPNLYAIESYWKKAKDSGAFTTEEDYQQSLKKKFITGGYMPDDYFKKDNELRKEYPPEFHDEMDRRLLGKKTISSFLKGMVEPGVMDEYDTYMSAGGTQESIKALYGAMSVMENLYSLGSTSNQKLDEIGRAVYGDQYDAETDLFRESRRAQFRLLNPESFADLAPTGEFDTNLVQKYSDATAFGTDGGYNAILPYWAEQGDERKEIIFLIDKIVKVVSAMQEDTSEIAGATVDTAEAIDGLGDEV